VNRLLVTAFAAAALASFAVPAGADPAPVGSLCAANVVDDGVRDTGEIDGGPVAAADLAAPGVLAVTVTCSFQTGGTGLASDPDAATESATGTAVAYLPPTPIDVPASSGATYVCTTVTVTDAANRTVTLYADAGNGFVDDESLAHCAPSTEAGR
jgi:hypothetical protein